MPLKSWWAKVNGGLEKNLFFRFTARMVNWTWRKVSDVTAMELLLSSLVMLFAGNDLVLVSACAFP
jgi:hypothetical protein